MLLSYVCVCEVNVLICWYLGFVVCLSVSMIFIDPACTSPLTHFPCRDPQLVGGSLYRTFLLHLQKAFQTAGVRNRGECVCVCVCARPEPYLCLACSANACEHPVVLCCVVYSVVKGVAVLFHMAS